MKTNSSAGWLVKIRGIMVCATLAAIFELDVYVGASLAARIGHTTVSQTENLDAPNVSLADLVAAASGVR